MWYWQPFYQFCFKVCLVQVCYSVCLLALAIALSPLQRWVRSTPLRSSSLAGLLWLPSAHSPRAWLLDHWTARLWIAWYSCKIPVSACIMQSEHCFDKSWATHQLIQRFWRLIQPRLEICIFERCIASVKEAKKVLSVSTAFSSASCHRVPDVFFIADFDSEKGWRHGMKSSEISIKSSNNDQANIWAADFDLFFLHAVIVALVFWSRSDAKRDVCFTGFQVLCALRISHWGVSLGILVLVDHWTTSIYIECGLSCISTHFHAFLCISSKSRPYLNLVPLPHNWWSAHNYCIWARKLKAQGGLIQELVTLGRHHVGACLLWWSYNSNPSSSLVLLKLRLCWIFSRLFQNLLVQNLSLTGRASLVLSTSFYACGIL